MRKMLLNATHQEELRVAIVDGQELVDLDIDSTISNLRKGNIYKGIVTRIEPSLEAAFVDYGSTRQGFLPLKEISKTYFKNYDGSKPMSEIKIRDILEEGQELIVQIDKDERGNKGAALSTFISLAGRFIVLMPNNSKGGGISRRISGEERQELRDRLNELNLPKEHALIFRTAGIGRSTEEFQWDLDYLMRIWNAIQTSSEQRPGPFLIYQENNVIVRALRDYMNSNIDEFLIDDEEVYQRAKRFMEMIMPQNLNRLKHYQDSIPLFSRYQVEMQIEAAFSRHVKMKSGAELVIDHTEAVTTVDVNSAKATSGGDIEETALKTNLEAVDEIAKQLRIRDIGGLIVIDFIDMVDSKNQRTVEKQMASALKADRARIQIGKISKFGLLEMSRQRLRSALGETNYVKCPHCEGTGQIRSIPSFALSILRVIEEEALKENTEAVHAYLPLEIATYLLNEKRYEVTLIERRLATNIVLLPSADMRVPSFHIKRLRAEDISREKADRPSYKLKNTETADSSTNAYVAYQEQAKKINDNKREALIGINDIAPTAPPPQERSQQSESKKAESKGFVKSLLSIFGLDTSSSDDKDADNKSSDQKQSGRSSSGQNNRSQSGNRKNNNSGPNKRNNNRRQSPRNTSDAGEDSDDNAKPQNNRQKSVNQNKTSQRRSKAGGQKPRGRKPQSAKKNDNDNNSPNAGEAGNKPSKPRNNNRRRKPNPNRNRNTDNNGNQNNGNQDNNASQNSSAGNASQNKSPEHKPQDNKPSGNNASENKPAAAAAPVAAKSDENT